jgi:hypothetical protein
MSLYRGAGRLLFGFLFVAPAFFVLFFLVQLLVFLGHDHRALPLRY